MNHAATAVDGELIRFERLLPGPIERVWDYLTKPALQKRWLAESAAEFDALTRVEHHRSIEYCLRDFSIVSMEVEPRGEKVNLVVTHRRVPAWLAAAGAALVAAFLVFSFCSPKRSSPQRDRPGLQLSHTGPGLNSLHLQNRNFTLS